MDTWIENKRSAEFSANEGVMSMKKYVLTLAVLAAAALPNLAIAGDASLPATPTQMSDAELDSVAAGAVFVNVRNGRYKTINNPTAVAKLIAHNKNFRCVSGCP
jgi:hypothetical protein